MEVDKVFVEVDKVFVEVDAFAGIEIKSYKDKDITKYYSSLSHSYENGSLIEEYDSDKRYVLVIQILMNQPVKEGEGHWFQLYIHSVDRYGVMSKDPYHMLDIYEFRTAMHIMKRAVIMRLQFHRGNCDRNYLLNH